MYKAIITDVDDTLVESREDALLSKRVIEAVTKAQEKGVIFTIATGRPLEFVGSIVDALHLTYPLILENGAKLYSSTEKRILWQAVMDSSVAQSIVDFLQGFPYEYAVVEDGKREGRLQHIAGNTVTKIGIYNIPLKERDMFRKKLVEQFPVHIAESSSWSGKGTTDYNLTDPMGTKQYALLEFAKHLSIDTKEIIGIGDHENDYSFLLACGLKVAMGNAIDSVKAIADYVAPTIEEDGVADVIEKYILK